MIMKAIREHKAMTERKHIVEKGKFAIGDRIKIAKSFTEVCLSSPIDRFEPMRGQEDFVYAITINS